MTQGKGEGKAQLSVRIHTTKNVRNSVRRYVSIVCTHIAFAGRRSACRILIGIPIRTKWTGVSSLGRKKHVQEESWPK